MAKVLRLEGLNLSMTLGEKYKYMGAEYRRVAPFLHAYKTGGTKLRVPRERGEGNQQHHQLGEIFRKKNELTFCAVWGEILPSSLWISTFGNS